MRDQFDRRSVLGLATAGAFAAATLLTPQTARAQTLDVVATTGMIADAARRRASAPGPSAE